MSTQAQVLLWVALLCSSFQAQVIWRPLLLVYGLPSAYHVLPSIPIEPLSQHENQLEVEQSKQRHHHLHHLTNHLSPNLTHKQHSFIDALCHITEIAYHHVCKVFPFPCQQVELLLEVEVLIPEYQLISTQATRMNLSLSHSTLFYLMSVDLGN